MDVKGKVPLQHFNKSKFINETKTFLRAKIFLLIVKFKKLEFSAPLMYFRSYCTVRNNLNFGKFLI